MKNLMIRLFREEEGQGMVEYAILVAVIAMVVMLGAITLGNKINKGFESLGQELGGKLKVPATE